MKFTKSHAEVYLFEGLPHHGWAKFTVQDLGPAGRLSIASDYGDWQHGWSAAGSEGFKAFLTRLDRGYVAGKFGVDRCFDPDGTIQQLKVDVIEERRFSLDKTVARGRWDEIKSLDLVTHEHEFYASVQDCNELLDRYEGYVPTYHKIHPLFERFWEEAWPLFIAELRREIEVGTFVHS